MIVLSYPSLADFRGEQLLMLRGGGDMYFLQEHINTPSGNKQKLLPLRIGGTYIYKCVSGS